MTYTSERNPLISPQTMMFPMTGPYHAPGMGRPQSAKGYKAIQSRGYHPGILSNDGAPGNFRAIANNSQNHVRQLVNHDLSFVKPAGAVRPTHIVGARKQTGRMVDYSPLEREVRKDMRMEAPELTPVVPPSNRTLMRNAGLSSSTFTDQNKSNESMALKNQQTNLPVHRQMTLPTSSTTRKEQKHYYLPAISQQQSLLPMVYTLSTASSKMSPLLRDAIRQTSQITQPHRVVGDESPVAFTNKTFSVLPELSDRSMAQQPHRLMDEPLPVAFTNKTSSVLQELSDRSMAQQPHRIVDNTIPVALTKEASSTAVLSDRSLAQQPHNIATNISTAEAMRKDGDELHLIKSAGQQIIQPRVPTTLPFLNKNKEELSSYVKLKGPALTQHRFEVLPQENIRGANTKEIFAAKPLSLKTLTSQPQRETLMN